jgi:carbon monoxide dehydrogenase subunit G
VQLENSFTVPLPIDEAWRVLMDIDRIAPCMPGAILDSVEGDDFTGRVKVKLGPINLTYQGKGSFIERDETGHKAVIDARGKDQRGNGTAAAIITANLASEGSVTRVDVLTDLNITGRPAQFGRGVMTDVGNKLLGQFADKLSAQLASGDAGIDAAQVDTAAAGTSQEPTVAGTATTAAASAAASTTGVVEEVAASVRGADKAADEAADEAADKAGDAAPFSGTGTVEDQSPVAEPTPIGKAAKKAPSKPPTGTTAPPNRPASSGPARSAPRPASAEPEPIDLLEVAGGAAMMRYAAPAGGVARLLLRIASIVRRRRG